MRKYSVGFFLAILLSSCTGSKQLSKSVTSMILRDSALVNAHVGISVFDPATGKYLYDYQGDKYFVPASNTKLPTCYAAMKYLGDSLPGIKYGIPYTPENKKPLDVIVIQPTGDPTFLHADFTNQPVFDLFKQKLGIEKFKIGIMDTIWRDQALGSGWSWSDYESDYMAERNSFPIFGNVLNLRLNDSSLWVGTLINQGEKTYKANYFKTQTNYFDRLINAEQRVTINAYKNGAPRLAISRSLGKNEFSFIKTSRPFASQSITFATFGSNTTLNVVTDSLKLREIGRVEPDEKIKGLYHHLKDVGEEEFYIDKWNILYSQATDSMLRLMMHRSDNFFAEQSLLMVSNQRLGIMNDSRIIDTLLKSILKDLPQPPRWVDGSGLSRYNLFSPRDFVTILNKMKDEFGMERLKTILPTGNEGTLGGLYIKDSGYIFAKTGTLSGVVALSGFVYTKKNRLLIFSMLVNNHRGSAVPVRKAYQKFVQEIREKY